MAWWGGRDPRIQRMLQNLEQGSRVPARAVRFHRLRNGFWQDLLRFQKRLIPRRGQTEEAERLLRRGEALEQVAEELEELMGQADDLSGRFVELEKLAQQFVDLAPMICDRCASRRAELARLGNMTSRSSELLQDRVRLQQIEGEYGLHREALELLGEANRQADSLGEEERASFKSLLRSKRLELGRRSPDRSWLEDLRRRLDDHPHQPQPPPSIPPPPPPEVEAEPESSLEEPSDPLPDSQAQDWPPHPVPEAQVQDQHLTDSNEEPIPEVEPDEKPADADEAAEAETPSPEPEAIREEAPSPEEIRRGEEQKERAADLLDEARIWLRELGDGPEKLQQLQQRFGKTPVHWEVWEGRESVEFLQAVEKLVEELRERAAFMRREKRQFLEEYISEYRRMLGSDEGLQADLDQLNRLAADSPEKHARWLRVAQEAESRFRGTAALQQDRLQESVAARLGSLGKEAEEFARRPLFREDRERLEEMGQRLDSVGQLDSLDSLLAALLESRRTERDLAGLQASVGENRTRLEQQKASLTAREEDLARAAALVEVPLPSLRDSIEKLRGEASEELGSLSESDRHIQRISSRLDEHQQRLSEACGDQLELHRRHCREVASSLQPLAGTPPPEEFEVERPSSDDLETLLPALQQARQVRERAEAALQQAVEQLERRRQEVRDDLQALPGSVSYSRDRRSQHLQGLFQEDQFKDVQDPLLLLARLRKAVERGEAFRDSFYRNQRLVREYRRSLPRRLNEFEARGLQRFAPRPILDRVTALIEGVGDPPDDWPRAVLQLQEAEALLTRLERHARRLESASKA